MAAKVKVNPWSYAPPEEIARLQQMAQMAQPEQPVMPQRVQQQAPMQQMPDEDPLAILGPYADAVRQSTERIAARSQNTPAAQGAAQLRSFVSGLSKPSSAPQESSGGGGGLLGRLKSAGGFALDALDTPRRLAEPITGGVLGELVDDKGNFSLNPRNAAMALAKGNPASRIGLDLLGGDTPYSGGGGYSDFMESNAPTGVKVGASVLADPLSYAGPGALGKLGKVGRFIEQPMGATIGGALGAGAAAQGADALDLPGWAQAVAPLAGGLAGGVAGANPRLSAQGAKSAGDVFTDGALSGERGSFDMGQIGRNAGDPSIVEPDLPGGAGTVSSPVPPATGLSGGGTLPPSHPPMSAAFASSLPLPDVGYAGAQKALTDTAATTRGTGPLGEALYKIPLFRKGAAIYNPSINQDPTVHVAHLASSNLGQALRSDFTARMRQVADNAAAAMTEERPVYRGPANNKIAGSWKDIVDHPEFYIRGPRLTQAMEDWRSVTSSIRDEVRTQFGVDVGDFQGPNPDSVYAPTVPTKASIEDRLNAVPHGGRGLGGGAMTQTRLYDGAYDLMQKNPAYSPITDPHELAQIIANGQANNAATETFRLGVGGMNKAEIMAETHPELVKMRDEALAKVESLKGKLDTALARSEVAAKGAAELDRPLTRLQEGVIDKATAKDAIREARSNMNIARREALAASRDAGGAVAGDRAAQSRLRNAIKRSDAAMARIAKVEQANRDTTQSALGLGEVAPTGMGIRLPALQGDAVRAAVDEAVQTTKELRAAWAAARSPLGPNEAANTAMLRRGVAEIGAGNTADELRVSERAAMAAAEELAPDVVHSVVNQLQRRMDALRGRGTRWSGLADSIQQELTTAKTELEKARDAWAGANPTRNAEGILGEDYVLNPKTNRYHPLSVSKSIKDVTQNLEGGAKQFADTMDWIRATHLNLDASPLWIQGTLGFFQDPIVAAKSALNMIGQNPTGEIQRIALAEPELVRAYSQATGKQFGRPIAEFGVPKGLDRFKPVAAANDTMQSVIQRFAYEQWKNDFQILLKKNPGMSPVEAQHEAAMLLSKTVPSLNPAERGLSPSRASIERAVFTSTSFATSPALLVKDMTSAVVKLAKSGGKMSALDGREQLALLRGGWMMGSLTTLSVASAYVSAESRGVDPQKAVLEALDPRSKYFWSIQLGEGRTVSIGGPLRSFAKAITASPGDYNRAPGESLAKFAYSKLNSPISGTANLWFNKDYRDEKIRNGDFSSQMLDSLRYAFEQVAPTSVGAPLAAEREGATFMEGATNTAGQLLGANVSLPSPTERLDQIARDFPGSGGKEFFDLEPSQKEEIKKLHPDAYNAYLARASDATQEAHRKKAELLKQEMAAEDLLLSKQLSPRDWKLQMDSRRDQLRGAESIIYGDKQRQKPTDEKKFDAYILAGATARDRYYRAIDVNERADGTVDWDKVDAWKQGQTKADQDYIDRNTGLGGTELQKLRRQLSSEYYELPVYRGLSADEAREIDELSGLVSGVEGLKKNAPPRQRVRALALVVQQNPGRFSEKAIYAAQRQMLGLLKSDSSRLAYEAAHPEVAIVKAQAPLNGAQVAAIRKRMGGQVAA